MRKHLTRMLIRDNIVDQADEVKVRVDRLERREPIVTPETSPEVVVYDDDGKAYTLHVRVVNEIPRLLLREKIE